MAQTERRLPERFTIRQLAEAAGFSLRQAHVLAKEGLLITHQDPNDRHYVLVEDWLDFFNRLEGDRKRLQKPYLKTPVTRPGEKPERIESPFVEAVRVAEGATRRREVAQEAERVALANVAKVAEAEVIDLARAKRQQPTTKSAGHGVA